MLFRDRDPQALLYFGCYSLGHFEMSVSNHIEVLDAAYLECPSPLETLVVLIETSLCNIPRLVVV